MESSSQESVPAAKAVLLGALASGVNASTWSVIKMVFLSLGLCFAAMLFIAFASDEPTLILHVLILVSLGALLFLLLSWFLSQTGLVSVDQQMAELGITENQQTGSIKDE
ncbi:uncharacterized protein LOC126409717 [Nymphaea colorata]|nr:uncharacterized protein LOC126409717 [Nymphaea colorata]XP_049931616.1 uncharacterized protein LOC126409717 [Nymphaea colorata]XP_049931617.1 uncharacterized protein LOC126409717 [Nymphaea colorata]XP_049931618.1 uncharacterized protein LOC126409717 [Nymphaea colorata]XP_049931619.1 uncharacterized protein LOC126409717 [Nymphaea colorata]